VLYHVGLLELDGELLCNGRSLHPPGHVAVRISERAHAFDYLAVRFHKPVHFLHETLDQIGDAAFLVLHSKHLRIGKARLVHLCFPYEGAEVSGRVGAKIAWSRFRLDRVDGVAPAYRAFERLMRLVFAD
jgi:hypothetical protein